MEGIVRPTTQHRTYWLKMLNGLYPIICVATKLSRCENLVFKRKTKTGWGIMSVWYRAIPQTGPGNSKQGRMAASNNGEEGKDRSPELLMFLDCPVFSSKWLAAACIPLCHGTGLAAVLQRGYMAAEGEPARAPGQNSLGPQFLFLMAAWKKSCRKPVWSGKE